MGDLWFGKPTRMYICQSSMQLWVGLQLINIKAIEQRRPTREEEKEAIRSYPYDTSPCRCRDCRYNRLHNKVGKK